MQPNVLVLTPTAMERQILLNILPQEIDVELCGFGLIAAAVETMRLIANNVPDRVLLVGIAGTYDPQTLPVGSATEFQSAACWGIGAGEGSRFQSSRELGLPQIDMDGELVFDQLNLDASHPASPPRHLLSVCSSAASDQDVAARTAKFPNAIAEDMEAFAVALACKINTVPITVLRGISNKAGDRDQANWQIDVALGTVAQMLETCIKS